MTKDSISADLSKLLSCPVLAETAESGGKQVDFGKHISRKPAALVCDPSEQDIINTFDYANRQAIAVRIRGSGHSAHGQTLTEGIQICLQPSPIETKGTEWLTHASGGATWGKVESRLAKHRKQTPILPDHYGLSVAGTLSVGGYGADSIKHGTTVNHVQAVKIITPTGEILHCDQHSNHGLLQAALVGHGQFGVIKDARISTTHLHRYTALQSYRCNSLTELAARTIDASTSESDICKALYANGRFVLTCGAYADKLSNAIKTPKLMSGRTYLRWTAPAYRKYRSGAVKLWLLPFRQHFHLWSDYFFDADGLREFSVKLENMRRANELEGTLKAIYMMPIKRGLGTQPMLEPTRTLQGKHAYGIGLYCMVNRTDQTKFQRTREALRQCLEYAVSIGGKPYLYGMHDINALELAHLYGESWHKAEQLRQTYDPNGILSQGWHKLGVS